MASGVDGTMVTTDKVLTRSMIDDANRLRGAGRHRVLGVAVLEKRCVPKDAGRMSRDLFEHRRAFRCSFADGPADAAA